MPQPTPMFSNLLNPNLDKAFVPLCDALPVETLPELRQQVQEHVGHVRLTLHHNEFLDVTTAEKIAETLCRLFDQYPSYPTFKQRLIVGAARYFVYSHNSQPDLESLLGFDDDVAVLNFVLVELGEQALRLDL